MSISPPSAVAAPGRWRALDGLRGVAALVVVFHHSLLALPAVANLSTVPETGSPLWWALFSPLRLFSAGFEAVLVFFVLSGLVLVAPVLRATDFDWIAYYFRRSVRLYLPVVASIAFAAVCILVSRQTAQGNGSSWVALWSVPDLSWGLFVQSLDIFQPGNPLNNPLWTLRWEMIFSLALPLFAFGALLLKSKWWLAIFVAVVLVGVGTLRNVEFLSYLPVFFAGALLAANAASLTEFAQRTRSHRWGGVAWGLALAGGLVLLILHFLLQPFVPATVTTGLRALSFVGAVVVVAVAMVWMPFARLLTIAPVRWLGRVSFSLYLVHVPIIIACANLLAPAGWMATIAVAVPVSLLVAELFTRLVESPAHRLSKRIGDAVSARVGRERVGGRS